MVPCLRWLVLSALVGVAWLSLPDCASAFVSNGRWSFNATNNPTLPLGNPVTLTWSIVPDGTTVSHLSKPSDFVAFLDGLFGSGAGGTDYTQRPWFGMIESCFNRWSEVSGLVFEYEPADDGLSNRPHGQWLGSRNFRGDVRLGGALRDGPGGVYAEAGFIPNADITFDTADTTYFGTPGSSGTYLGLRNTLTHEIGHSIGLGHTISSNARFLMESAPDLVIDGPQFDDIRGAHYLYGDALEVMGGNNTPQKAHHLGSTVPAVPIVIGHDATLGTSVLPTATDFVSISNATDIDCYAFDISAPAMLDLIVTPVGPTYNEFVTGVGLVNVNASSLSDLTLELLVQSGSEFELLASVDLGGLGSSESILDFALPIAGTYVARVTGSNDGVQFYTLSVSVESIPVMSLGDFSDDGVVNLADYTLWRDNLGAVDESALLNRGDGLPGVDAGDYRTWVEHFGEVYALPGIGQVDQIPEASTAVLMVLGGCGLMLGRSRRALAGK